MWAKQSTAATLIVGPILDSAGAEYTSAVIGDLSLSKNGGTLTALASAATLTHIANGQYTLVTTTGNTDTLGRAQITCNKSTYQMPPVNLMILPAMIYDAMVLGSDRFDTNVTHIGDQAQTARDIGASVLLSSGTGTGQLKLASGYVAMTWADIAAPTTTVNLSGTTIATTQKVDVETIKTQSITCAAGVTVPALLASTTNITAGTITTTTNLTNLPAITSNWLTAAGLAADAVAEIQSGLSTLTQTQVTGGAYALNSASFAFDAAMDFTTAQKAATLARVTLVDTTTTNADMRGTDSAALAATALSTAVWTNGLATNLETTNTTVAANLDAAISTRATPAQVNAEVLDVLNVDTFAEETGVPAATSSLRKKIGWMFMWFRNKVTQTGTTSTLFADDGSTAVVTHTVSDDATTFTSGEGA